MEDAYGYTVGEVAKDQASKLLHASVLYSVSYLSMSAMCPLVAMSASGVLAGVGTYASPVVADTARAFIRGAAVIAAASYLAPVLTTSAVIYTAWANRKILLGAASLIGQKINKNKELQKWWKKWRKKCKVTLGGSKLFENIKKGKGKLKGMISVLKEGLKTYKNRMFSFLKSRFSRGNNK